MILFQLFLASYSANIDVFRHRNLVGSIRKGNSGRFQNLLAQNTQALALRGLQAEPGANEQKIIFRTLVDSIINENELKGDYTPLILVTLYGDSQSFVLILTRTRARIDFQNLKKRTALMFAIKFALLYNAKILLGLGADSDISEYHGRTALQYVCLIGDSVKRERAILLLLQNHAYVPLSPLFHHYIKFNNCNFHRIGGKSVNLNADETPMKGFIDKHEELVIYFFGCLICFILFFSSK